MDRLNKPMLRAAMFIHEQLAKSKNQAPALHLSDYSWNNVRQLQRQIEMARRHGWHGAARRLTIDLSDALGYHRRELENALAILQSSLTERPLSSASDIYRDLLALENEFEEVNIDLKEHLLSVTTDRIVLDGTYLGAFSIRLDWQQLGCSSQPYRVVALDPHPAAKSNDITHPHVQDEHLCEGDGCSAIRAALAESRLYDFFLLVSQLLHTYSQGNGYAELDDWDGVPCEECGASLNEDERYSCQRCGSTLCGCCSASCQHCGDPFCSGCIEKCAGCQGEYCSGCLAKCRVCRGQFCGDCLEAGRCRMCHEKQVKKEHEHDPSENARNEPVVAPA